MDASDNIENTNNHHFYEQFANWPSGGDRQEK